MLDTHAIARSLIEAGLSDQQADAITAALRQAAEHPTLDALATKTDLADLEARLAWRLIGAGIAVAGIQTAVLVAILRLFE